MRVRTENSPERPRRPLSLHIPNSHPRATSPRSSPLEIIPASDTNTNKPTLRPLSPALLSSTPMPSSRSRETTAPSQPGVLQQRTDAPLQLTIRERVCAHFKTTATSGESARDFLARERTLFSWLRLSMLLSVASSALYLRLRLKESDELLNDSLHDHHPTRRDGYPMPQQRVRSPYEQALLRKAVRRPLAKSSLSVAELWPARTAGAGQADKLRQHFFGLVPPTEQALDVSTSRALNTTDGGRNNALDTNVTLSEGLGIVFFILALLALAIGHIDYMRAERALEHADEVVPDPVKGKVVERASQDGAEDAGEQDREAARPRLRQEEHNQEAERQHAAFNTHAAARRAAATRWHDARHANRAHSGRLVQLTEILIAFAVFATAIIILATSGRASVAPIPPHSET